MRSKRAGLYLKFVALLMAACFANLEDVGAVPREGVEGMNEGKAGWMGVGTGLLPKVVAEHMGVLSGTGLVVEEVEAGGPAELAGLLENDVIMRYGDQILVNPEQLAVLEGMSSPGDEVVLQILRKQESMEIAVRLGERPVDYVMPVQQQWQGEDTIVGLEKSEAREYAQIEVRRDRDPFGRQPRVDIADADLVEEMQRIIEQMQGLEGMRGFEIDGAWDQVPGIVQEHQFEMRIEGGGVDQRQTRTIRDDEGTIIIDGRNEAKTIEARDLAGGLIYEGPFNTDEDKEKVPVEIMRRVEGGVAPGIMRRLRE